VQRSKHVIAVMATTAWRGNSARAKYFEVIENDKKSSTKMPQKFLINWDEKFRGKCSAFLPLTLFFSQ